MANRNVPDASRKPNNEEIQAKIKQLGGFDGYQLHLTTGQRQFGPPPDWTGLEPGVGHEVYCGRIPKDCYEDEVLAVFKPFGKIYDVRIMMDPQYQVSKGFCFITFELEDAAQQAVEKLNNHEIRPGRAIKCNISIPNKRLFVGNIPKNKTKEEILEEFKKLSDGLVDVIVYGVADDQRKKNRGFAFLDYDTHKNASAAKRRLGSGRYRVWNCDILVDWADPLQEPDELTMGKVKVLYVRNLTSDVTEEELHSQFSQFGEVERAKKVKDYGFIHFTDRDNALRALRALNGVKIGKNNVEVSLAKPPSEFCQKKKDLRKKEAEIRAMLIRKGMEPTLAATQCRRMMTTPLTGLEPYFAGAAGVGLSVGAPGGHGAHFGPHGAAHPMGPGGYDADYRRHLVYGSYAAPGAPYADFDDVLRYNYVPMPPPVPLGAQLPAGRPGRMFYRAAPAYATAPRGAAVAGSGRHAYAPPGAHGAHGAHGNRSGAGGGSRGGAGRQGAAYADEAAGAAYSAQPADAAYYQQPPAN